MAQDTEFAELMRLISEKSMQMVTDFKADPTQLPALISQYTDLIEKFQSLMTVILDNPEKVWQMQLNYWEDLTNLAQTQFTHWLEGKPLAIDDARFSEKEWLNSPFSNFITQYYLLASLHINSLLEQMVYKDKNEAKRLKFFIRQYLDALSPANFLTTNPHLMAETVQSHGKNLLHGLHNLLNDMEGGPARLNIKMTDTNAFKVGVDLAITPGKVIFRNPMMELIQYTPQTPNVKTIPLLIIPPWINKYYILDLGPHNSFVNWLVGQGITVFMISWVNPDKAFEKKTLFDYVNEGPLSAVAVIQKQLNVKQVNALGFCIGGTLLALLLAYQKAHKDNSIHSATFLASLIDFSDPGDIAVFIDEQQIKKIEHEMKEKGYLAGKFMASSFNSLRANDLIWSYVIKNYLHGKAPPPFDILFWNADSTNMPATMHSQYLRWMYLHNNLVKPGKIKLNHTPIDVSLIDIPTFFLSTKKDHIAPWQTTYKGYQLMSGPKQFVLGGSGHVAGIINPPNVEKYGYRTNDGAADTAEEWLEKAIEHPGSWWPEWGEWLKKQSGKAMESPELNQLPFPALMDAPGSYVLKK